MSIDYSLKFKVLSDARGKLIALEGGRQIPFDIKRIYYLYDLNDLPRGFHAHYKLKQVMICLNGSLRVYLDDGKGRKENIELSNPQEAVLIDNLVWHEMHDFSKDCVIAVLASDYYDEADYIRDYSIFEKAIRER
ncbi:dTDP-6-deoxy-3,4-keto-hexulose isomerase [Bdellovibrio bacteriovorus]|uniref:dTDP-6-deoxy-3,4-keto-hexulose isomerase n=1 Tax=Bdellovibrio bacteriovorus TaxID=959 RepID=A0A150WL43_BDEBC|nr:FdtA/QdtA family cupin domain-containing protein [Bdellovibrio bacteriovorus]KYG64729.1 dTDP-6-deoxy-3,4-keto-hexulose isomerase [Bdellovibrio bacteriovorus]